MKPFLLVTSAASFYVIFMAVQEIYIIYQTKADINEIQQLKFISPNQDHPINPNEFQTSQKESTVKQQVHNPLSESAAEYKHEALLKLISMENEKREPNKIPPNPKRSYQSYINYDETYSKQVPSPTRLNLKDKNFNFANQTTQRINIQAVSSNGKIIPGAKYIIENNSGHIISESRTDKNGFIQTNIPAFSNERIYVRFLTPGMPQDKILITKTGEKK